MPPVDGLDSLDLERYPLDDVQRCRNLVERCREELSDHGYCELSRFLRDEALIRMTNEAASLAPLAHRHSGAATPYLEIPRDGWPDRHPRLTFGEYSLAAVAYDHLPAASALRQLYESDALMSFLADCLSVDRLYRYADPLGACNVAVMRDGDELEWHFDQTDFVVSLALQRPEEGGEFECFPRIRNASDERYEHVATALGGDETGMIRVPFEPGTMLLFQGRYSMHRVSPVRGATDRLVVLLSYDNRPGTMSSPLLQEARYGRVRRS